MARRSCALNTSARCLGWSNRIESVYACSMAVLRDHEDWEKTSRHGDNRCSSRPDDVLHNFLARPRDTSLVQSRSIFLDLI